MYFNKTNNFFHGIIFHHFDKYLNTMLKNLFIEKKFYT